MSQGDVQTVFHETIFMILKLAMPMLVVSMALGLIIAIFQAATQIHEQTLTFVPKLIAIAVMLILIGSWMMTSLEEFFHYVTQYMLRL